MSEGPFKTVRNLGIVALVALLIALAPGGGTGLSVALWILTVAFFAAILWALWPYRAASLARERTAQQVQPA